MRDEVHEMMGKYFIRAKHPIMIMGRNGYIWNDINLEDEIHAEDYMNKLEGEIKSAVYQK